MFGFPNQADLSLIVHDNSSEQHSPSKVYQLKIQKETAIIKHGPLTVFLADVSTPMVSKHQTVLTALNSKLNLETMIPKSVEKITKAHVELALQKGLNLGYRMDIGKAKGRSSLIKLAVVEFMGINQGSEVEALLLDTILKSNNKYIINEYLKYIVEDLQDIAKLEDCLNAGAEINHLNDKNETILDKLVHDLLFNYGLMQLHNQLECSRRLEYQSKYYNNKSDHAYKDDSSTNDSTKESTTANDNTEEPTTAKKGAVVNKAGKCTFVDSSFRHEAKVCMLFELIRKGARLNNLNKIRLSTQDKSAYQYLFEQLIQRKIISQHTPCCFEFLATPPHDMFDVFNYNKTALFAFEDDLKNALTQLVTGKSDDDKLGLLKPYIDSSIKFDSVICYQLCWNCMGSSSVENMKPHIEEVIAKGCVNILEFMIVTAAGNIFLPQLLEIIIPLTSDIICHSKINDFWKEKGLAWEKLAKSGQLAAVKFDRVPV